MFDYRRHAAAVSFALLAMGSTARAVEPMESVRLKINFALAAATGGNPFGGGDSVIAPVMVAGLRAEGLPRTFPSPLSLVITDPPPPPPLPPTMPVPIPSKRQTAGHGRRKIK
jgi:hypothetical protein